MNDSEEQPQTPEEPQGGQQPQGQPPQPGPEKEEAQALPLGGWHLARILGIDIYINRTWLIIFGLVTWSLAVGFFPAVLPRSGPGLRWGLGAVAAVLLFASVLIHELTHSLVAIHHGLHISGITLFLFGGVSNLREGPPSPGTEFKVAVAGPLSSFALGGVCYLLYAEVLPGPPAALALLAYLTVVNLLLGLFNLIPGFPLDGGRVLRAFMWWKTSNRQRSTIVAAWVGAAVGWAFIALGLVWLATGEPINGVWLTILGLFLRSAANYSSERARAGQEV